jgi:hypothetical protein
MAMFITRIELHSTSEADYTRLHSEMANRGFSRSIQGADANWYRLPAAEYWYEGNATTESIFKLAESAADMTGSNSWIVVSATSGCRFRLAEDR